MPRKESLNLFFQYFGSRQMKQIRAAPHNNTTHAGREESPLLLSSLFSLSICILHYDAKEMTSNYWASTQ